jgi:ABC-type transport system involved in multi-copper enzyme maturation permease subunit
VIPLVLARNTFREVIRDRVLTGVTAFGVAFLLLTRVLAPLALGEDLRLTVDMGLSAVTWFGMLVILLVGASLVAKEIDRRTIYNLLSRPVPRPFYLVGKWAGLSAGLWVVATVIGGALILLVLALGARSHALPIAAAVYLAGLELTVMAALAVLFSALSTPVLSALYTLAFFCAGQWSYDLRIFAAKFPPAAAAATDVVASLLPSLPLFNARALAAAGEAPGLLHLGIATAYALLYAGGALCLAALAFETREFK